MEALLVVPRENGFGNFALDLDGHLIGRHQVQAAAPVAFGESQNCRQCWRRRVGQQAIDAILGDRELGIVVIVGMDENSVREGGKAGRQTQVAADHRATALLGDVQAA